MQVRTLAQALDDLRELAASDNVDTFVISYNSLLQVSLSPLKSGPSTPRRAFPRLPHVGLGWLGLRVLG